jgi:hypothetical protein
MAITMALESQVFTSLAGKIGQTSVQQKQGSQVLTSSISDFMAGVQW